MGMKKNQNNLVPVEASSIKNRLAANIGLGQAIAIIGCVIMIVVFAAVLLIGIEKAIPKDKDFNPDDNFVIQINDNEQRYNYGLATNRDGRNVTLDRKTHTGYEADYIKAQKGDKLKDVLNKYQVTLEAKPGVTTSGSFIDSQNNNYAGSWFVYDSSTGKARDITDNDIFNDTVKNFTIYPKFKYTININLENYRGDSLVTGNLAKSDKMNSYMAAYNQKAKEQYSPFTLSYRNENTSLLSIEALEGWNVLLPDFVVGNSSISENYFLGEHQSSSGFKAGYYVDSAKTPLTANDNGDVTYSYKADNAKTAYKASVNANVRFNTKVKVYYTYDNDGVLQGNAANKYADIVGDTKSLVLVNGDVSNQETKMESTKVYGIDSTSRIPYIFKKGQQDVVVTYFKLQGENLDGGFDDIPEAQAIPSFDLVDVVQKYSSNYVNIKLFPVITNEEDYKLLELYAPTQDKLPFNADEYKAYGFNDKGYSFFRVYKDVKYPLSALPVFTFDKDSFYSDGRWFKNTDLTDEITFTDNIITYQQIDAITKEQKYKLYKRIKFTVRLITDKDSDTSVMTSGFELKKYDDINGTVYEHNNLVFIYYVDVDGTSTRIGLEQGAGVEAFNDKLKNNNLETYFIGWYKENDLKKDDGTNAQYPNEIKTDIIKNMKVKIQSNGAPVNQNWIDTLYRKYNDGEFPRHVFDKPGVYHAVYSVAVTYKLNYNNSYKDLKADADNTSLYNLGTDNAYLLESQYSKLNGRYYYPFISSYITADHLNKQYYDSIKTLRTSSNHGFRGYVYSYEDWVNYDINEHRDIASLVDNSQPGSYELLFKKDGGYSNPYSSTYYPLFFKRIWYVVDWQADTRTDATYTVPTKSLNDQTLLLDLDNYDISYQYVTFTRNDEADNSTYLIKLFSLYKNLIDGNVRRTYTNDQGQTVTEQAVLTADSSRLLWHNGKNNNLTAITMTNVSDEYVALSNYNISAPSSSLDLTLKWNIIQ